MAERLSDTISQGLFNFQAALKESGSSLEEFVQDHYINKWMGDTLYRVLAIRTTLVTAMHMFLADAGLFNIDRVSMSPVTDPLAHDVEHTPSIQYKGHLYMTTHSMIYSKFLACFNPNVKGIFIDSPNIRLELESPERRQRGKYLIDFSQMDIEVRRNRGVSYDVYLENPDRVTAILEEDRERALGFFEDFMIYSLKAVAEKHEDDLKALGVAIKIPQKPFPRYRRDEAIEKCGTKAIEGPLGKETDSHLFWVTGLMRENYDLIYPFLQKNGSTVSLDGVTSDQIYNYDLCAQSFQRESNTYGPAWEVLSGAIREWLYEPIVERLIANKILKTRPIMKNGNIENIDELDGYGPFLMAVSQLDDTGSPLFPETFGGGLGIERFLFAMCMGEKLTQVDQVTCFGKNPDSYPLYLF